MFQERLKSFCTLFLLSATGIVCLLTVFDDRLFFHSDPRSMSILVGSSAFLLTILAGVLLLLFARRVRRVFLPLASAIVAAMIVALFFTFVVDIGLRQSRILPLLERNRADLLLPLLALFLVVLVAKKLYAGMENSAVIDRIGKVAVFVTTGMLLILGLSLLSGPSGSSRPARIVLIVLDAWPTSYIHSFNNRIEKKPIDEILSRGRIFSNARTRAVWTAGYFGTLYQGKTETNVQQWPSTLTRMKEKFTTRQSNLFADLQTLGVTTRWVSSHSASVPESHQVSDYPGFRSIFFTHHYAPFLHRVGLKYNLILSMRSSRSLRANRRELLAKVMTPEAQFENTLVQFLIPEMKRMNSADSRTFLLFHTPWGLDAAGEGAAWKYDNPAEQAKRTVAQNIVRRDYRYLPQEEWMAQHMDRSFQTGMNAVGRKLTAFWQELERGGLLENTMLILTADHGEMAARGRLWYGFHPDEEVTRVPLVVYYAGKTGTDNRSLDTVDLHRTILEFFGGTVDAPGSVSLLNSASKPYVWSVTQSSDVNREWFLVLQKQDVRYLFNLHKKGNGTAEKFIVRPFGFDKEQQSQGAQVIEEVRTELREVLRELRIPKDDLHSNLADIRY